MAIKKEAHQSKDGLTPFERFDALARNVLSVSNKAVRASIEADDLQIVVAIVEELRKAGFKIRIAGGELITRARGDRKLTSHERRLVQRLGNYYEAYSEQVAQIIGASAHAPGAS